MVTQEYALAPGGEGGCVTRNCIKVTSYSSLFSDPHNMAAVFPDAQGSHKGSLVFLLL